MTVLRALGRIILIVAALAVVIFAFGGFVVFIDQWKTSAELALVVVIVVMAVTAYCIQIHRRIRNR